MLKTIIFDFDGTIADTQPISYLVYQELAKKHNIKILSEEEYYQLSDIPLKARFKKFGVPLYKMPSIVRTAIPLFHKHIHFAPVFDGVKEMLESLRLKGIDIIILSSNSNSNIQSFLKHHQLDYFTKVIGKVSMFGKAKKIKQTVKHLKLNSNEVFYVGDEVRDIIACRKAQVPMITVSWGYDNKKVLEDEKPKFLINHPLELIDLADNY